MRKQIRLMWKQVAVLFAMAATIMMILSVVVVMVEASEKESATTGQDEIFQTAREGVEKVNKAIYSRRLAGERAAYAVQVSNLQTSMAQQRQLRQKQEATSRFGAWGPDLVEAAAMYGQDPAELYGVMLCESGGDQYADNGVCKGLFQFNPGTFAGTPYSGSDIFDGHSQIFAAAWMWSQGRKGEWTCAW